MTLEKEAGLREKIAKFDQKLLNIDVTALVKEIEEYKKGYEIERKKESQIVNVIDSQKKYISMRSTDQNFATKSNNFLIKSYKSTKI